MGDVHVAVVVGGGASGALATVQLLAAGWSVVLVDPRAIPGRGVAYGNVSPWHLLSSDGAQITTWHGYGYRLEPGDRFRIRK